MKILCSNLLIRIQKNIFAISSWKFESSTMLLESVSNKLDHPFPSCVWIVKHKHEAQQGLSRGGMKCLAAFDPAGFRILLTSFKVVLFSQRRTNNAEPRLSSSAHYLLLYRRVERRLKVRGDGPVFFAFSCQSRKVLILQDRYCLSNTRVTWIFKKAGRYLDHVTLHICRFTFNPLSLQSERTTPKYCTV